MRRSLAPLLVALMLLPSLAPPGVADVPEARPDAPQTRILGIEAPERLVSGVPAVFRVQCAGPCGGAEGVALEFAFHGRENLTRPDFFVSEAWLSGAVGENVTFTYNVTLPRSDDVRVRASWMDGVAWNATAWAPLGVPVENSRAHFPAKPGATYLYRGASAAVDSTRPGYFAAPGFRFDLDHWDNLPPAVNESPPQSFTWRFGPYGNLTRTLYAGRPVDASLETVVKHEHLSRGGCFAYTVTADDAAGQARENASFHADAADAVYTTRNGTAPPSTFVVEHVCVRNAPPTLQADLLHDPADPERVLFHVRRLHDLDHEAGYDRLVLTLWDRDLSKDAGAAGVVGAWDWENVSAERVLRVPRALLSGGASLCVMDKETDALVGGVLVRNASLDASDAPVCNHFSTLAPEPPAGRVHRLEIDVGEAPETSVTVEGALVRTRRVLAAGNATADLAHALEEILAAGVGPDRVQQVVLLAPGLPSDARLDRLVVELTALGVLVIVPAGLPTATAAITPHWEIRGLAAHPDALTVGAAREDGAAVRAGSAFGPSPLLRAKPDVTVRAPDALDERAAQAFAVRHAAELALWYELRGVSDPLLVKALVMRQAQPVLGETLGLASMTGAGALDPRELSRDPARLDPAAVGRADVNATLDAAGPARIVALPVTAANAMLDVGVVNHRMPKGGALELVNPNGLLPRTLRTARGEIEAPMTAAAFAEPRVTVNVTFYSVLDLLRSNLTHATLRGETADRLAELASRTHEGAQVPAPEILVDLARLDDAPPAYHFIPEATTRVPRSAYEHDCTTPSLQPLENHVRALQLYAAAQRWPARPEVQAAMDAIRRVAWDDCPTAMRAVDAALADIQRSVREMRATHGSHAYLDAVAERLERERSDMWLLVERGVDRARVTRTHALPLRTDANATDGAPLGPYVGVVRVTTHGVCDMDADGGNVSCANSTEYLLAGLHLVGTAEFILRDRAGRPMPGRPVTLDALPPNAGNCAGAAPAPWPPAASVLLRTLHGEAGEHAMVTDASGVARFPFVQPGHYDVHDGHVGFPVRATYEAGGADREAWGFREADCHEPVPVGVEAMRGLGAGLDAAARAGCAVKLALAGVPVVNAQDALAGAARCALSEAEALAGLAAIDAATDALAGATRHPVQRWEIVFPQVQQGRMVDAVRGSDVRVEATDAGLTAWKFNRSERGVRAESAAPGTPFGLMRYDFRVPPNEELAHFWSFRVDMANTEGLAVFTLREDTDDVLRALALRSPPSAAAAATTLVDMLAEAPGSCSALAHHRIVPLLSHDGSFNVSGLDGLSAEDARLDVSGLGRRAEVGRFIRFHTRECPADEAHVFFLFWRSPRPDAGLAARFEVNDQRIWTWSALGTTAHEATGRWGLAPLPPGAPFGAPMQVRGPTSVVVMEADTFEPKAESWDLFVDVMDHTRRISVTGPPAAAAALLRVERVEDDETHVFETAPGLVGTLGAWAAEFERAAYLPLGASPAGVTESESYLAGAGTFQPDRSAEDRGRRGRLTVAFDPDAPCDMAEHALLSRSVVFGDDRDDARFVSALDLLRPDASRPSLAHAPRTVSWRHHPECISTAVPRAYFDMLHLTREAAAAHPRAWTVIEHHAGAPNATDALPRPAPRAYPVVLGAWTAGANAQRHLMGFSASLGLAELVRDPGRLGFNGTAAYRDGDDVYALRVDRDGLAFTRVPATLPRMEDDDGRGGDDVLGVASRPGGPLRPVVEEPTPAWWHDATGRILLRPDPAGARAIWCDPNACTLLREPAPGDAYALPPRGQWVALAGREPHAASCTSFVERPAQAWIWHPFARTYVALAPREGGDPLDPCLAKGASTRAIEAESLQVTSCSGAAGVALAGASAGRALTLPDARCRPVVPTGFGRALDGLSLTFGAPASGRVPACGAWQALTMTQGVLGTSREACAPPGAFVTTPLALSATPEGGLLLRWVPAAGTPARVVLDRVTLAG